MSKPALRRVCVYCGASPGHRSVYAEAAAELGAWLAQRGTGIVTGGGSIGMMGVLADAALGEGGEVIGVITHQLDALELGHPHLTQMIRVKTMHQRKATMAELADGFIALPGGFGTLEELFEATTWSQLGIHAKPVGLLNVAGFFTRMVHFLDHASREGFLHHQHRELLVCEADPHHLCEAMEAVTFPDLSEILRDKREPPR